MEKIVAAAIRGKDGGNIYFMYPPARHHTILHNFVEFASEAPKDQGFMTNKERFVDRVEAKQIALAAGQVKETAHDQLFTEDLW